MPASATPPDARPDGPAQLLALTPSRLRACILLALDEAPTGRDNTRLVRAVFEAADLTYTDWPAEAAKKIWAAAESLVADGLLRKFRRGWQYPNIESKRFATASRGEPIWMTPARERAALDAIEAERARMETEDREMAALAERADLCGIKIKHRVGTTFTIEADQLRSLLNWLTRHE